MRFLLIALIALSTLGFGQGQTTFEAGGGSSGVCTLAPTSQGTVYCANDAHAIAHQLGNWQGKRKHALQDANNRFWIYGVRDSIARDKALQKINDDYERQLNDLMEQADAARQALLSNMHATMTAEDQKNNDSATFKGMEPTLAANYLERLATRSDK